MYYDDTISYLYIFERFIKMKTDKNNGITHTKYWSFINFDKKRYSTNFSLRVIKFLKNLINKGFLNKFGFEIKRKEMSFRPEQRSYTDNSQILSLRNDQIANFLIRFGSNHSIGFEKQELLKNIQLYDSIFKNEKISNLNGGMGFNNGLFLFILFSHFQPKVVIESGVWRGFTTYLIDKAISKDSKIYCFDINLTRTEFKSEKATYYERDLSLVDDVDFGNVNFAFFDDHVSIYDRLQLCFQNKIEIVVVDDDVSLTQVHSDGWPPIPTASMLFNYDKIPKKFDWISNGISASADISGLKVDDICEFYRYIPFPKLDEYTGYKDSSFTSLLLKS